MSVGSRPPLLLVPRYVVKPWGGRRLETLLGRDLPQGPIGESWEVVDTEDVASVIEGGPFAGKTLREVYGRPFPLLIKVLDACEDLSIQVHPDGERGKEEAWASLADTGSVAVGAGPADTPPERWLDVLERLSLSRTPPSLVHVPAGTVHAILAGAFVFEVQTPVDVTWRLHDYERPGVDGRPRRLHLEEARAVLERGPEAVGALSDDGLVLTGQRFSVALLHAGRSEEVSALVAFLPAGGTLQWAAGTFSVPRGRTVVLPDGPVTIESEDFTYLAHAVRR